MDINTKKQIDENFKKLLVKARKSLRKEWNMINATEEEFRKKANQEMQKLLKEVRNNRKRVNKLEKDLKQTVDYFDSETRDIKRFVSYKI